VALGRFQAWWPLEGKGKTSFSPPSTFHPIRFYLNLYSIDFKVLFYHGCRALFTYFLPFPWPINYNHDSRGTKSSTHFSLNQVWSKIFSLPWIHGVTHDYVLQASSCINEQRIAPGFIPKFDINLAPLQWRFQNVKGAPSFRCQTLLSLVL
jgi:hypothetical protein